MYGLLGNRTEALAHGLRARQLVRQTRDDYNLPLVELMLARAFLLDQQPDSALALARHGLALSQEARNNNNIRKAAEILADAYAQNGNFEEAYRYRNLHMAYADTLSGEDTKRRTSAVRYKYELDKKQAQINLLTKDAAAAGPEGRPPAPAALGPAGRAGRGGAGGWRCCCATFS